MPQIEVKNLIKHFMLQGVSTEVLKGVDFQVEKGETVGIVGASGAGKSTLLHILGTLDNPTTGEVFFDGKNIFKKNDKETAKFRNFCVGFIFQFHHLLPDFTALENVMMPLLIRGEKRKMAAQCAENLLEKAGLKERLSHKPDQLSGGEQQRVAVVRAVVGIPQVILADEPTGNLDAVHGEKVFDLLLSLNKELKTTLIVVTHNQELAGRLQRMVHIVDGKICP